MGATRMTTDKKDIHFLHTTHAEPLLSQEQEQAQLPVGFVPLAAPMLLLTPGDGRYIARVYAEDYQTDGILVYEDGLEVAFFSADEAIIQAMYILREAWQLLPACDPTMSPAHADAVEYVRSHRELQ